MKTIIFLLAGLIVFFGSLDAAQLDQSPLIACAKTDKAPKMDGKLDDACWKAALWTSHFRPAGLGATVSVQTWMATTYTKDALYIGWNIIKKTTADKKPRKNNDFVFMFIHPDRAGDIYFEFICNSKSGTLEAKRTDYSWKGEWRGVATENKTGWSVEIMAPYKTMKVAPPKPGDVWGFNPGRKDPDNRKAYYMLWADIGQLHDLANYGRLLFVDELTMLRLKISGGYKQQPLYISPLSVGVPDGIRMPARKDREYPEVLNKSFENGMGGWNLRYSNRTYPDKSPAQISDSVSRSGKRSLCVTSTNDNSIIQVTTQSINPPSGRFEISARIKLENPKLRDGVNLFADTGSRKDIYGGERVLKSTMVDDTPGEDGWRRQAVRFELPKGCGFIKFGVEIVHYTGKVWIDDIKIRRCTGKNLENDGMWFWDARIPDPHGMAPRKRLFKMMEKNSPWIPRAQKYNDTLVAAAFARDKLKQLQRISVYNGKNYDPALRADMKNIHTLFELTARTFNDLYLNKKVANLKTKLDPALDELDKRVKQLDKKLAVATDAAIKTARARAGEWTAPTPPPARKRPRVRGDGSVDQLVFGSWGKIRYKQLGRGLDIWTYTSAVTPGKPPADKDGSLDWSIALKALKDVQEKGIPTLGLRTIIMSGGGGRTTPQPPSWVKKYGKSPDIYVGRWLNNWNPAVYELTTSLARDIATTLRGNDDILFYHYAWESSGPIDAAPDSSPSGIASLRRYIRKKHKTTAALNKAWGGDIKSFDAITSKLLNHPKVGQAFRYDYQMWRQDAYIDHLKSIYTTWKKHDPDTAVMAAHSNLFTRIDPTRIFETCDLLNCHTYLRFPDNLYLASSAPVAKKYLCKFENFWQYQEQSNRWGDERAQYAAVAKYLYRNALTGEVVQTWCFPYTSQAGWNWRQAQWCQTRNDYLTIRYSAAALPVARRRVERMQKSFFLGTRRDFADTLLVWPRTSWLQRPHVIKKLMPKLVFWLHGRGICFEYRTEERIASGAENLADYKLIILPNSAFLKEGVAEKLLQWTRAGGTLLTIGPAGLYNQYGKPDGKLMKETTGVAATTEETEWDFSAAPTNTTVIRKKTGKGEVAVVTIPFQDMLEDAETTKTVESIIRRAAPQFARSEGDALEFFRRIAPDGTRYLAVLNGNPDANADAEIIVRGEYRQVVDIDIPGGFPARITVKDNFTRFKLRLQPAGMTVLRLDSRAPRR